MTEVGHFFFTLQKNPLLASFYILKKGSHIGKIDLIENSTKREAKGLVIK